MMRTEGNGARTFSMLDGALHEERVFVADGTQGHVEFLKFLLGRIDAFGCDDKEAMLLGGQTAHTLDELLLACLTRLLSAAEEVEGDFARDRSLGLAIDKLKGVDAGRLCRKGKGAALFSGALENHTIRTDQLPGGGGQTHARAARRTLKPMVPSTS